MFDEIDTFFMQRDRQLEILRIDTVELNMLQENVSEEIYDIY